MARPARESKTRFALLGLLSTEPMSGYDIRKTIQQSISYFWQEGYGQIYPTLKRLVEEKLATLEVQTQAGKPDRQVYSLTDEGVQELRRWLNEPATEWSPSRNEVLLKLFFGRLADSDSNLRHVQQYREGLESRLALFESLERQILHEPDPHGDIPYWLITLKHGLHGCRAALAWCDETTASLKDMAGEETASGSPGETA